MDFGDNPAEAAYRQRLREWLGQVLPGLGDRSDKRASLYRSAATRKWQRLLYDAGYIGQTWPREIGGQGLGPTFDFILNEECALARAPSLPTNVNYLGRSIAAFGSAAQRDKFLQQTMSGDIHWCQGFSEPSGGSDLAGLRTRAVRDGDRYLVNGQKLWTSGAHDADWCFLLARTETGKPRHQSISVLLVDMRSPGIEPHNVRTTDGTEPTGSCFFDDVEVPAENLLGLPGQGWEIAMSALSYERGPADTGVLALVRRQVDELTAEAVAAGTIEEPRVQRALADAYVQSEVLRLSALRQLSLRAAGRPVGPEAQVAKLLWSATVQRIAHVGLEISGGCALTASGDNVIGRYFESRHASVFGGTAQIQRNLLAQRGLGLPRSDRRPRE
jgi:alkylation response protein AidB-like acyl-CoA dehydrogenase